MSVSDGPLDTPREPRIYRVRELNLEVAALLRRSYGVIEVAGEISGWKPHGASGHCYFSLVDARATLRCVLYRDEAIRLAFVPANGVAVVARGRLGIYPEQGNYQLTVERLVPAGAGAVQAALEALKLKLRKEGLFDDARKRPLPPFPEVVGVVTSRAGAAWKDMLRILHGRWPAAEILIASATVQGPEAPGSIVAAISRQVRYGKAQVLLIGRGGGAAEDLAAFNDERVVRAIAACPIPTISAVGHETDVTLADLVADRRASTPSRAAELAVPDAREVRRRVTGLGDRQRLAVSKGLERQRVHLRHIARGRGLYQPRLVLEGAIQQVDELREGLRAAGLRLGVERAQRAERFVVRLERSIQRTLAARRPDLARLAGKIESLSPIAVLARGYALCAAEDGSLVRDGATLQPGQAIALRFARGGAEAAVTAAWGADDRETP